MHSHIERKEKRVYQLPRPKLQKATNTHHKWKQSMMSRRLPFQKLFLSWQLVSREKGIHDCSWQLRTTAVSSLALKKLKVETPSGVFKVILPSTSPSTIRSEHRAKTKMVHLLLGKMIAPFSNMRSPHCLLSLLWIFVSINVSAQNSILKKHRLQVLL